MALVERKMQISQVKWANKSKQIDRISKQFNVCFPLNQFNWNNIFNTMDNGDQEHVIKETVDNDLTLKYPVKVSYQVAFLKQFIAELESKQFDISDSVYNALGRLMALQNQEHCYKHYTVKEGCHSNVITLKENPHFISEGTTGLCSWEASVMLSQYLIHYGPNNSVMKTLELGSGNGLVGLSIWKHCSPTKVILSDCHPSVLNRLIDNIKLNSTESPYNIEENLHNEETTKVFTLQELEQSAVIEVHRLSWGSISQSIVEALDVTCVVAADVIYDASLFKDLIHAVNLFLKYGKNCEYFQLACTVRNLDTLNTFFNMLNEIDLQYEDMVQEDGQHYIRNMNSPMRLLKITLKN